VAIVQISSRTQIPVAQTILVFLELVFVVMPSALLLVVSALPVIFLAPAFPVVIPMYLGGWIGLLGLLNLFTNLVFGRTSPGIRTWVSLAVGAFSSLSANWQTLTETPDCKNCLPVIDAFSFDHPSFLCILVAAHWTWLYRRYMATTSKRLAIIR
jgi:hypothetical protein